MLLKSLLALSVFTLTGCAMSIGNISDNKNSVRLESGNFVVEKRVDASSSTAYLLGLPFGGPVSANDVAAELSRSAELYGKPRALTNYAIDKRVTSFPFLFLPVVTFVTLEVSADVVEFSERDSARASQ